MAAPSHPPGPQPVPAGSGGTGVSARISLRVGAQPLKGLSNRIFFLLPGEPQALSATFVSGRGAATRIISLDYRIVKAKPASPAAPLEIELIPPGEKAGRKVTLFADGRSRVLSIWRREFPGNGTRPDDEEILLELKPASPGESAAVAARTLPNLGRSFRIRVQLTQALLSGDKTLENSDFIAPMGDSARAEYDNLTVRMEKRAVPGNASADLPPTPGAAAGSGSPAPPEVRTVGNPGLLIDPQTGKFPVPAAGSAPANAMPAEVVPAEVAVEDHDRMQLKISAESAANHRLRYAVSIEGTLAAPAGKSVPLHLAREFSGYRHETASLIISAPGALYQYSLRFDPDWQEEEGETGTSAADRGLVP